MNPTLEQSAILDFIATSKSNLMIRARAGCGKSSTLKLIDAKLSGPALMICFNKSIADEATKSGEFRSTTLIKTMNSIGHKIWADSCASKLVLSKTKILDIYRDLVADADRSERTHLWSLWDNVSNAVNMARAVGYIPSNHAKASNRLIDWHGLERYLDETPMAEVHALADKVLLTCIAQSYKGIIDYNDQCYMPALFSAVFPRFPNVLIDEYQDLSPINLALVAKLCKSSRQIGVGDEAQAIYGFRGADEEAMPKAVEKFGMSVLPLSLSFRCPEVITSNVHWHVPDIRSFTSGGVVESTENFSIQPGTAVICRYNAPLIALAMECLTNGQKVDVGGIDIGARVIKLLAKLGSGTMTQHQTLTAIADWQAERESLDSKSAADMAECMRVFVRHGKTLSGAIAYAEHIFKSSSGEIQFLSGHRAKGLEFNHVYHLNSSSIRPGGQEQNIHYVIDTRPRQRLTYIETR